MPETSIRWDRVWLTATLVLGVACGVLWWSGRPERVGFEARLWEAMDWRVRQTGALEHPAPEAYEPLEERGEGNAIAVTLGPGHYVVELRARGATEALTVPLLVPEGAGDIHWDLWAAPPEGYVPVPPGPFLRGPGGRLGRTERLFFAARCEVTRGEWRAFLDAMQDEKLRARHRSEAERIAFPEGGADWKARDTWGGRPVGGDPRLPVGGVSWYAAQAYASWLTETQGEGRWRFRLPRVLEWEKLARGTDGRTYPWGYELLPDPERGVGDEPLLPVDGRPDRRSPYGLYQTFGNVAEWCADAVEETGLERAVMGPTALQLADLLAFELGGQRAAHARPEDVGFRLVAEPLHAGR